MRLSARWVRRQGDHIDGHEPIVWAAPHGLLYEPLRGRTWCLSASRTRSMELNRAGELCMYVSDVGEDG